MAFVEGPRLRERPQVEAQRHVRVVGAAGAQRQPPQRPAPPAQRGHLQCAAQPTQSMFMRRWRALEHHHTALNISHVPLCAHAAALLDRHHAQHGSLRCPGLRRVRAVASGRERAIAAPRSDGRTPSSSSSARPGSASAPASSAAAPAASAASGSRRRAATCTRASSAASCARACRQVAQARAAGAVAELYEQLPRCARLPRYAQQHARRPPPSAPRSRSCAALLPPMSAAAAAGRGSRLRTPCRAAAARRRTGPARRWQAKRSAVSRGSRPASRRQATSTASCSVLHADASTCTWRGARQRVRQLRYLPNPLPYPMPAPPDAASCTRTRPRAPGAARPGAWGTLPAGAWPVWGCTHHCSLASASPRPTACPCCALQPGQR